MQLRKKPDLLRAVWPPVRPGVVTTSYAQSLRAAVSRLPPRDIPSRLR